MKSSDADPEHAAGQQIPAPGTINLDHVAHFVRDMDAASRALDELGLILTPFSPQTNRNGKGEAMPTGTANRVVMLKRGYFEILAAIADTLWQSSFGTRSRGTPTSRKRSPPGFRSSPA